MTTGPQVTLYRLCCRYGGTAVCRNGAYTLDDNWPVVRGIDRNPEVLRDAQQTLNLPLEWVAEGVINVPMNGGVK